jgi:hypothetical protein
MLELLPDPSANIRLLHNVRNHLSAMSCVQHVIVFGSFAQDRADRWSDIDILVVTANRTQFRVVFSGLAEYKPIVWRGSFVPQVQPSGGNILGIVFEGESVFHNVDLNFMTLAENHMPDALTRFGVLKELYAAAAPISEVDDRDIPTPEPAHPDNWRIFEGFHFTRKAIKQLLRGADAYDELRQRSDQLRHILNDYAPDFETPYGKIGWLAHHYLAMADTLLQKNLP